MAGAVATSMATAWVVVTAVSVMDGDVAQCAAAEGRGNPAVNRASVVPATTAVGRDSDRMAIVLDLPAAAGSAAAVVRRDNAVPDESADVSA